jgi:hypothetical protein
LRFDVLHSTPAFFCEFLSTFFREPESKEDSGDGANCRGDYVIRYAFVVAGGEAEHEEVVAERDEEEGGVEDADAEKAEGAGTIGEAEEVVEKEFQVLRRKKVTEIEGKGNRGGMVEGEWKRSTVES